MSSDIPIKPTNISIEKYLILWEEDNSGTSYTKRN